MNNALCEKSIDFQLFAIASIATLILVNGNSKWYIYHPSKIGQQKRCCRKSIKWSVTASFLFVLNYFFVFMISSKMFLKNSIRLLSCPAWFWLCGFFLSDFAVFVKNFMMIFVPITNYAVKSIEISRFFENFSIIFNFFQKTVNFSEKAVVLCYVKIFIK